jgi:hypothetical protein
MRAGSSRTRAGQPVEVLRRICDDIDARIQPLLTKLVPALA